MVKRPVPQPDAPQLSPAEIKSAIARFQRRISDLESFDPATVGSRSDPRIKTLAVAIDEALSQAFGHQTPEYRRYRAAALLDRASHNYLHETPLREVIEGLTRGKEEAIALLRQAIRSFEEKLADFGGTPTLESFGTDSEPLSLDVFIVHA